MRKKINSIEQLKREKEKLKIKMEVTEHAFLQSFEQTQKSTKELIWSNVKLPVLVIDTAIKGAKHLFSNGETETEESAKESVESNGEHWLQQAIPVALSLVNSMVNEDN